MSGVEIAIPVIAAVFALVSAFKDGGTIAEKLKERRQRRGAQPPSERLVRVLHQGAQEIENTHLEGVEEFGDAFKADAITAGKIKDITIVLQDSIIKQLAAAFDNDDINDFNPAISSIISARKEALTILNEHYISLQRRKDRGSPLLVPSTTGLLGSPMLSVRQHERTNIIDTITSGAAIAGTPTHPLVAARVGTSFTETTQSSKPKSKSGSWRIFAKRQSVDASPQPQMQTHVQPQRQSQPQPQPQPQLRLESPPASTFTSPEDFEASRRTDLAHQLPQSPPVSVGLPSPAIQRTSTALSAFEPVSPGVEIKPISATNHYGGLCKGAFHAQNYNLRKAMEPSMREFEWMYHCRKCKFRLTADSSQRGNPHFDDRIQTSLSTLNFRFLFLWKSHVPSNDVQKRQYKCVFCLLSKGESAVYGNEDHLFGHISRHEGEVLGSVVVQGMIEVGPASVLSSTMEGFDVYFPLDQHQHRRPSHVGSFMLPESALEEGASRVTGTSPARISPYSVSPHLSPQPSPHPSPRPISRSTLDVSPRQSRVHQSTDPYAHGNVQQMTIRSGEHQHQLRAASPRPNSGLRAEDLKQKGEGEHVRIHDGNVDRDPFENAWRSERPRFAELDATSTVVRGVKYVELDATEKKR